MDWVLLNGAELKTLIDHIGSETVNLPGLFDTNFLHAQSFSFNFYQDCRLIMLENHRMQPPFTLDYLQSGETIVYLDGSAEPFEILNTRGLLRLNEDNIVDYLRTYLAFVNQRPHNILLLQDPELMPYEDTIYIDFHFDKNNYSDTDIKTYRNDTNTGYIINAPFVFGGKIDLSTAHISDQGLVEIEQVQR